MTSLEVTPIVANVDNYFKTCNGSIAVFQFTRFREINYRTVVP